jgi:hypothetical protein
MIPQRGLKGEHLKADGALMSHVDLRGDLFLEGMIVRVAKYIIIICRWQANKKQSNRKGSIRRTESLPNSKSPTLTSIPVGRTPGEKGQMDSRVVRCDWPGITGSMYTGRKRV